MEYQRYCGSINNTLSPKNFAMSLVSYAHHSEVSYYVARVERMPKKIFNNKKIKITWNDFLNFNKCLFVVDRNVPKNFLSKIKKSLNKKEIYWLNSYHKKVFKVLKQSSKTFKHVKDLKSS